MTPVFITPLHLSILCALVGLVSSAHLSLSQPATEPRFEIVPQTQHVLGLNSAVVSASGRFLATSGEDQLIKLWDVKSARLIRTVLRVPREVKYWKVETLSSDGRRLLGIESDRFKVWDTITGDVRLSLPNASSNDAPAVVMSSDGLRVAAIGENGTAALHAADTGRQLGALAGHAGAVMSVAFSPDGKLLATGGADMTVRLWDAATGQSIKILQGAAEAITSAAFTEDGRRVLAKGTAELRLWDVQSGSTVWQHRAPEMTSAHTSPDGRRVLVALKPGTIETWDTATSARIASFPQLAGTETLGFSQDGTKVIVASGRQGGKPGDAPWITRSLDAATGGVVATLPGASSSIWAQGRHLLVETADSSLSLRSLDDGREIASLPGTPEISAGVISSSGARVATASAKGIAVRDAATGKRVGHCHAESAEIRALAFSPDERQLLIGGQGGTTRLCDLSSGKVVRAFENDQPDVRSLTFSPDGKRFLSGSSEGHVRQWDFSSGRALWTARGSSQRDITSLAYSPNGRRAFAGTDDNRVRILDSEAGRELKVLRMLTGPVYTIAVSSDGRRVAAAGYAQLLVKQWDVETGKELQRLQTSHPPGRFVRVDDIRYSAAGGGLLAAVSNNRLVVWRHADGRKAFETAVVDQELKALAFSRDGKRLVAVDEAGVVRHWSLGTGALLITIFSFGEEEWLAVTPEGFFDGSAKAEDHLTIVKGLEATPIGRIKSQLHRPDLVAEKLAGDPTGKVRGAAARLEWSK